MSETEGIAQERTRDIQRVCREEKERTPLVAPATVQSREGVMSRAAAKVPSPSFHREHKSTNRYMAWHVIEAV